MKWLLTGATGFLGRNLLLRALRDGHEVFAPVRDAEKLRRQLDFEGAAQRQVEALSPDPAQWPALAPDCAVLGAGVLFARSPREYFTTNVDWTLHLIHALPRSCRIILISSQAAAGPTPARQQTLTEADASSPITWYGESKLALERHVKKTFSHRPITILRPPMILGARDTATLPLFRMARGPVRIKPGWKTKTYSFIDVDDMVEAIARALRNPAPMPSRIFHIAHPEPITDWQLIAAAAEAGGRARGCTIPLPQVSVQLLSALVDAIPALRAQTPSLTRDRARDIWRDRWVIDGSQLEQALGWRAERTLRQSLKSAHDYYVREGSL